MIRDTLYPDSNIPINTKITSVPTANYRNTNYDLWLTFYVNYEPTSILCQRTYNQALNHSQHLMEDDGGPMVVNHCGLAVVQNNKRVHD